MAVVIDGTTGISTPAETVLGNLSYTGTLTGGTGVVNLGSGQVYKDASGNVGIGTSVPADSGGYGRVLDIQSPAGAQVILRDSDDTSKYVRYAFEGGAVNAATLSTIGAGTYLVFGTGNTERARIDSSGNLLVGTTSNANVGNGATNITTSKGVTSTDGTNTITLTTTGGAHGVWFNTAAFRVFNAGGTGAYLSNTATSWSATSDERTKTALVPFENAAAKISAMVAGTGRYLTDDVGISRSFLTAQSVRNVLPEAVEEQDDELKTLGLRYTDVIPLLVAAIQEQQTTIVSLQDTLTALTAQTSALEERLTALEGAAA